MADKETKQKTQSYPGGGGGDAVYALGLIGALVYYITTANGLIGILLGILKALVWPAFVVYDLLHFIS